MKKLGLELVITSLFAVGLLFTGLFSFNVKPSLATTTCTPVDKYIIKSSDSTSEEVNFDFKDGNKNVDISADSGYTITEVWLDVNGDGINGYVNYGSSAGNYNPSGNDTITSAKVRVVKTCATPTASASGASKVYVCKYVGTPGVSETLQTGQNPIEVSVNALPNGWSVGNYFNDQQGRSYVLATVPQNPEPNVNNCPKTGTPVPTSTPWITSTPFASSTPFATSTPSETATPKPCDGDCDEPTETPSATSTPVATVFDVCQNIDGIQTSVPDGKHLDAAGVNCVEFSPSNPSESSSNGGGSSVTPQVLGTSTMAGTGVFEESLFYTLFSFGSLLTSLGIMKNGKKKAFSIN